MMLHPNSAKGAKLRSWRGRHKNFRVLIHEIFNDDLQTVDKYSYEIMSSVNNIHYDSLSDNMMFNTVDSTKDAAIERIDEYKERMRNKIALDERPVRLTSLNPHNYRHGQENPKVIGLVHYTPDGLGERLCFKVQYPSDGTIDYVAYSSFTDGDWAVSP